MLELCVLKKTTTKGTPIKIINAFENISAAVIKLPSYPNSFLYVVRFLDQSISKYLTESEEAINFYYTVENNRTGIKITFAIIYIITLLLYYSLHIAKTWASFLAQADLHYG